MENTPKRIINWWLTWEDLNWPSADISDKIKRRAEEAAKANVTTAILYAAHFRWDYLPFFTLLHDHIAETCQELHKYGIELYDRHSVNLIHRYDTREQMRHVMLHSGPHIPLCPSREAAKSWQYKGKFLNDWRMLDVRTRQPLYYPQYAGEGFCYRNPEFIEAYADYAKNLIADTGIDGLAAEDPVHYMYQASCGCPHCRAELKRRTGMDLPDISDGSFWGNWDNPAWRQWLDLRLEAGKEFFEKLTPQLPKDFVVTTCGQNSATNTSLHLACDASRYVAGGSNYIHMEMSGNTPPYKNDPVTVNVPVASRMVGFSHHQAVAREAGMRSFSTGYGFTEPSANIIWALNKLMDVDCCFSTLKARLGLPEHILKTLPEEAQVVKNAYTFEKKHPQLFSGELLAQVGVFFSYETRNNTLYGSLQHGYYADYAKALQLFSNAGVSFHTLLRLPEDPKEYPVIVLSGVAKMTDEEQARLARYLEKGGKVLVCGPTALAQCESKWQLPNRLQLPSPEEYFSTIRDGVWIQQAPWMTQTRIEAPDVPKKWQQVSPGLYYNSHRAGDPEVDASLLELCSRFVRELPVQMEACQGYLTSMFRTEDAYVLHLLAQDYDVDIDRKLDDMRFHRSRVNYVNQVTPINVSRKLRLRCASKPEVFTPLDPMPADIAPVESGYEITLPQDTAYVIVRIPQ